jgi:predicted permease
MSVALTTAVPLDPDAGGAVESVAPEGYELPKGQTSVPISTASVSDAYFSTLGIQILRGRAFNADDRRDSRRVAIVNEEFARTYWPGQNAVGRRIRLGDGRGPSLEVVGVAKTSKYHAVTEAPTRFLYLPWAQDEQSAMSLILRTTSADPDVAAGQLRALVRRVDVRQPIYDVRSMASFYQRWALAPVLFLMEAVTAMGLLGLALALIGLYGLVTYSVSRRTREIGIRIAVGASPSDILGLVVLQGLRLSFMGILLGSLTSVAVARGLFTVLVGLGPINEGIYAVVPLALLGLTTIAAYLPARRASRVDPTIALRAE